MSYLGELPILLLSVVDGGSARCSDLAMTSAKRGLSCTDFRSSSVLINSATTGVISLTFPRYSMDISRPRAVAGKLGLIPNDEREFGRVAGLRVENLGELVG